MRPPDSLLNRNSCFDKHTMLSMVDGSIKSIQRIMVGDRLLHDGIVTSIEDKIYLLLFKKVFPEGQTLFLLPS